MVHTFQGFYALFLLIFRHEDEKKQAELGVQDVVSRKILVLGAGKVSSPLIEYHTRKPGTSVTVGKLTVNGLMTPFKHIF